MSEATITISADEYFNLREQAQINVFLTNELLEIRERLNVLDNRVYNLEIKKAGNI